MARASIAEFRAATDEFDWTYAKVVTRAHVMDPENTNVDWVRVKAYFSRAQLKRISTLDNDEEEGEKERQLLDDMESEEALKGSATRDKKCPFLWFNFMLTA